MKPLEHAEYLLMVAWFNSNAVVTHAELIAFLSDRAPIDFHPFIRRTVKFNRVDDKVLKDLAQKRTSGINARPVISQHHCDIRRQIQKVDQFVEKPSDIDGRALSAGIANS